MKFLIHVFLVIGFMSSSWAQIPPLIKDTSCTECKKISLVKYRNVFADSTVESGIIIGNRKLQTSITVEDCSYVFGFGKQDTRVPRMSFDCRINQLGKNFNGTNNSQRVGIWFKHYPWGGLRKAIMYNSGQIVSVIIFRFNGNIKSTLNYRNGKKRNWGNYFYDKKGFVKNGTTPW